MRFRREKDQNVCTTLSKEKAQCLRMEWAAPCNEYCNIVTGFREGKNDSYIKVCYMRNELSQFLILPRLKEKSLKI